ncbi:Inactive protein-tyrosine phosphatase egg-5 [Dirofilaria immitis]
MVWVYWQGHCWWNRLFNSTERKPEHSVEISIGQLRLIEIARDANSEEWIQSVQIKYELARKEIKNNPPKMLKAYLQNIIHRDIPDCDYFQMNEKKSHRSNLTKINLFDKNSPYQTGDIIEKNDENTVLTEMLLYDIHYDHAWKSDYTKKFNKSKMKPLQELCDKTGISSDFFMRNEKVNLDDARSFILYQRPTRIPEFSKWLENDELNYRNSNLEEFFKKDWDGNEIIKRMNEFNWNVQNDLDQVRLQNQFYNNIVMWEALTGSRKQIFIRSMIGGMERRFEILDNQVNHIVFNHRAFDEHLDLCRNKRIKCRDSTRVVLKYPSDASNDFIHANYIQGGSLFNKFIITQAPMENTIGDFWRMVWQERSPYIFMLISRKEDNRCAQYWPKRTGDQITYYGLTIINSGVNEFRLPLFRVTYLLVIGSTGDELYVEHWQGDMNNSDNVALPLQLLRLARNCSYPTIIHCHLGISRSATLVAAEICIACLLKGPTYKCVQKAVQLLRSQRPFCIETPMQYIFVHRIVQKFLHDYVGDPYGFHAEYKDWIETRAMRPFIDDIEQTIPGYRLLSPRFDPDLIGLVRHRERPNCRREIHDCVGQMPIPLQDTPEYRFEDLQLTKRYPRGNRYD